jgi:hypothetical protein
MKNPTKKEPLSRDVLLMEIKMLVRENLKFCDMKSTPYLCAYKQSEKGYKDIEDFCIKAFFETNMDVSEALAMKENLLNPNYFID